MDKRQLSEVVDGLDEELQHLAQDLWERPELALREHDSSERIRQSLAERGFNIEVGVAGMPTAFVASFGEGDPKIGILGEFDALPGLSQNTTATRDPIEAGGPGHGCGHNLLGTAGVGAAIGVANLIERNEVDGTVVYFGCPAEEVLVGKTYMAREGVFDDLDAAITWHPSDISSPRMATTTALNSLVFTFEGTSAHAGRSPESGRSALDGVQLLNTGVEYMREHISSDSRVHYVITDGGSAPNVVPAEASVWYFVRGPDREDVERNTAWLRDIADAAATMSQTDVSERFLTGCYNYRANHTISEVIWENLQEVGEVDYSPDEHAFAEDLQSTVAIDRIESRLAGMPEDLAEKMRGQTMFSRPWPEIDDGTRTHNSTEVGDVSWIVPTGQFTLATWPVGVPAHTWQVVAANGDFAQRGLATAAKVLAGTVVDLMAEPSIVSAAREEFNREIGADAYVTPIPEGTEPPMDIAELSGR